ncbi:DUF1128 domain-containing protein [Salipaludibacillus daqingensis]|uniref:DUF1128 domain-containing protein n=1 Tax=Salipaludibacillus daqingensis TaxID=3041001 RepID=UPI0024730C4F|nr:DUF1128 domain-containing protein [Salipaludibacillus daqingensis]
MSTNEKNRENLSKMIEDIKKQLNIVNGSAIKAEDFSYEKYDDIEEIHTMVMKKSHFSVSEMDALISELGTMRDKTPEE